MWPQSGVSPLLGEARRILTTCRHLSHDIAGYDELITPFRSATAKTWSLVTGVDAGNYSWGIDGCALACMTLPLVDVARSMARLACPETLPL